MLHGALRAYRLLWLDCLSVDDIVRVMMAQWKDLATAYRKVARSGKQNDQPARVPRRGTDQGQRSMRWSVRLDVEPGHAPIVIDVPRDDGHAVGQRRCGNPEIVSANESTVVLKVAIRTAVLPTHVGTRSEDMKRREKLLPLRAVRERRARRQFPGNDEREIEPRVRAGFQERHGPARRAAMVFALEGREMSSRESATRPFVLRRDLAPLLGLDTIELIAGQTSAASPIGIEQLSCVVVSSGHIALNTTSLKDSVG